MSPGASGKQPAAGHGICDSGERRAARGLAPQPPPLIISTVNQCLDRPTRDPAGWDPSIPRDDVDSPVAAVGAAVGKGRVLLLEDDPEISEIVRDCLIEQGYAVVAVQNGEDGVREVLTGEFTMVFCDFMMPGLRGDALFRAIEKISPALCQGFVFMTGHQDDEIKRSFIRSVNALVLWKPFPLKNLLDSIALIEVRRLFESMQDGQPVRPAGPRLTPAAAEYFPSDETFFPQKTAVRARPEPPSPPPAVVAERARSGGWARPRTLALGGMGLFLAGAAWLGLSFASARSQATSAARELAAQEAEWATVSTHLQEAVAWRPKIERNLDMRARIVAERARPRWTSALHAVAMAVGERIHLLELHGSAEAEDAGSWTVRVRGLAAGAQSRLEADRFRLAVEDRLKRSAGQRPVSARFEKIGDEADAPGAAPGQPRTGFVVLAGAGSGGSAPATKKGKR